MWLSIAMLRSRYTMKPNYGRTRQLVQLVAKLSAELTSRNCAMPISPNSATEWNAASGWMKSWHSDISSLRNIDIVVECTQTRHAFKSFILAPRAVNAREWKYKFPVESWQFHESRDTLSQSNLQLLSMLFFVSLNSLPHSSAFNNLLNN